MLGATVEELQHRMTSTEFTRWKVFLSENPEIEVRSDFQMGKICATIIGALTGKSVSIESQMLEYRKKKRKSLSELTMLLKSSLRRFVRKGG